MRYRWSLLGQTESAVSCETLFPACFSTVLNVGVENCIPVYSPRCSGVLRLRRQYLVPRCMALGLRGALEGLAAQNRPMSEEALVITLRCNLYYSLECSLCFRNLDSTDVALGVGKGHPPVKRFADGPHVESFQLYIAVYSYIQGGKALGVGYCDGFAWVFLLLVAVSLHVLIKQWIASINQLAFLSEISMSWANGFQLWGWKFQGICGIFLRSL